MNPTHSKEQINAINVVHMYENIYSFLRVYIFLLLIIMKSNKIQNKILIQN